MYVDGASQIQPTAQMNHQYLKICLLMMTKNKERRKLNEVIMSDNGFIQALHFLYVLSGFIGSTSGFPEVLFDVVADCEVNVWKRTGFEKMLTENLLLKGLVVMIA